MDIKVSIIIPFNNRFDYLKKTLESIMVQSYPNFEVLIIDDHSSEFINRCVKLFIEQTGDSRFKLLKNGKLKGACGARNTGLMLAQGKFIIFLDSDDLLAPFCLERRIGIMENSIWDFSVFPMLVFYDNIENSEYLWNIETAAPDLDRFLKLDAVWQTSGPIWRKQFLLELGGFDENFNCWQDVDIHIRALLAKPHYMKFYQLPPDCYYRRNSENSISQQEISSLSKLNSRFLLARKLERLLITKGDIKYILANVLISGLLVKQVGFFLKGYFWSLGKPIFNRKEKIGFLYLASIILLRLDKLFFFNRIKNSRIQNLVLEDKIGKIKYEATN